MEDNGKMVLSGTISHVGHVKTSGISTQSTYSTRSNRIPVVDAAKGYGILLVFLGHLVYYDSPLFRVIFNFHMPLFFVLSGMTFSPEKDADCKSILKRIWATIGVPFLFFVVLGAVICACTGRLLQHSLMDWLRAGASFFHGDPYVGGSLWFLTCLAVVKFLFWSWYRNGESVQWNIGVLISAYAVGCVFGNYVHPKILLGGPLMFFPFQWGSSFSRWGTTVVALWQRSTRNHSSILCCCRYCSSSLRFHLHCPSPQQIWPSRLFRRH